MYSLTDIEHNSVNDTLTVSVRMDVEGILRELGDTALLQHCGVRSAAEEFGSELLEYIDTDEILDGFDTEELLERIDESALVKHLEGMGYAVADPDDDIIIIQKSQLKSLVEAQMNFLRLSIAESVEALMNDAVTSILHDAKNCSQ